MSSLPPGASRRDALQLASVTSFTQHDVLLGQSSTPGVDNAGPNVLPAERVQPQVTRRSVVPVEWFRRIPGGGTTYAPATDVVVDEVR